jgi:hypothetical protein
MGFEPRQWVIIRIPKDGSPAETLTVNNRDNMQFFQETFMHLREAHKYGVYIDNHLINPETRKMRTEIVDISVSSIQATEKPAKGKPTGRNQIN